MTIKLSWTDFIKAEVRLEDYIGRDESLTEKSGDELTGAHIRGHCGESKSGTRLNVNVRKQQFNCHACKAQGSVIDYVMDRDGVNVADACEIIANDCGLTLPDDNRTPEEREAYKQARARQNTVQGLLNDSMRFYHAQLTPSAIDYYTARGITQETIDALQLGYAGPDNRALVKHLAQQCRDKHMLLATGMFYEKDEKLYDTYEQHYVLPYRRNATDVCYSIARDATNSTTRGKYKKQPIEPDYVDNTVVEHILWNAPNVKGDKPVVIVEGIIDAILIWQELRDTYDVLSPVTTRINDKDIHALVQQFLAVKPKQVILCNDSEESGAGQKGALATADALHLELYTHYYQVGEESEHISDADAYAKKQMPYISIATLPKPPELDKIDVADYLAAGRKKELVYWLKASRSISQYRMWQEGNPRRFFNRRAFQPKRLSDEARTEGYYLFTGERLHRYENGVYQPQEHVIARILSDKLGDEWKAERLKEAMKHLQIQTYVDTDTPNPEDIISFKNGNIHMHGEGTWEFKPHSPDVLTTFQIEANWDTDAEIDAFGTFLEEIVGDTDVTVLMEMIGYGMMNTSSMHKAFLLLGEGANGKSTLLMIVTALYGKHNVCALPFQRLQENRFATADLYGSLANIVPDMPIQALKDSDIFKAVTSGDRISAERKRKDAFDFAPTTTQMVSVNSLPRSYDGSQGFFRRLIIVKFPHNFENSPDKRNQKDILADVLQDRDGIATHCLLAAMEARRRQHFTISEASKQIVADYQEENNPHERFLEECTEPQADAVFGSRELYNRYKEWFADTNPSRTPLTESKFVQAVERRYPDAEHKRKRIDGTQKTAWIGIQYVIEPE